MKSGKNYFFCNRSLFKNPLWYSEKFTKGQAWIDLFGNANHSVGYFEKNGQKVDIKRGQTGRSIKTLSEDWKWSRNKVKRFLKRLTDEHMIEHETNHLTSIITICNYDKFQFGDKSNEPSNEPPDEPSNEPPDEPQTNKDIKKDKRRKNTYTPAFEKWFLSYPKRNGRKVGKNLAFPLFEKIPKEEWKDLKAATENYSVECNGLPKDSERFLKNDFWKNYIEKADLVKTQDNGSQQARQEYEETMRMLDE